MLENDYKDCAEAPRIHRERTMAEAEADYLRYWRPFQAADGRPIILTSYRDGRMIRKHYYIGSNEPAIEFGPALEGY